MIKQLTATITTNKSATPGNATCSRAARRIPSVLLVAFALQSGLLQSRENGSTASVAANPSGKVQEPGKAEDCSPAAFGDLPVYVRPGSSWDWLNGSITREQISRDLEAMKRSGMRGGEIWDVAAITDPDGQEFHAALPLPGLPELCPRDAHGQYEPPASLEPVHEAALAGDDMEARRAYQARARELKETIGDPTETERAKVEAREELKVIAAHLSRDSRTLRDPAKAAGDAVRIGINRFLRNLVGRGDTVVSPLRGRRGCAKHLQRYLLVPSSRYAAPRARQARGELTGCLLYDPPAETRWAVSQ